MPVTIGRRELIAALGGAAAMRQQSCVHLDPRCLMEAILSSTHYPSGRCAQAAPKAPSAADGRGSRALKWLPAFIFVDRAESSCVRRAYGCQMLLFGTGNHL